MIRNKQKQAYVQRFKADFPSIPSPKRKPPALPRHLMQPSSDVHLAPTPRKGQDTGTATYFNSPRKKYLPEHDRTSYYDVCEVSIADQLRREEIPQQNRLAKILLQQRENLQNQREFLAREETKIDQENEWIQQRIRALTQKVKEMQSPPPLPRPPALSNGLERYMVPQKGLPHNETRSSDFFRSV